MRILFDHGTPRPLRAAFPDDVVEFAADRGWERLRNGVLIATAEGDGFEVLITTDQSMPYQQNLVGRRMAVVVLGRASWPHLPRVSVAVVTAVAAARPGTFTTVEVP